MEGLRQSEEIRIPRCCASHSPNACHRQLFGFCDASLSAYAAVIYLVTQNEAGTTSTLITSKTRVAPLQKQTISRLELLSAVLLSRLISTVQITMEKVYDLEEPICYTDSEIALHWIKGHEKYWKPFVQNRVLEIRKKVPAEQWYHCFSHENPADIPSRGTTPLELKSSREWFQGPDWLGQVEAPGKALEEALPEECKAELRVQERDTVLLANANKRTGINQVLDIRKFSDMNKLIRVTSLCLLFCERGRKQDITLTQCHVKAELLWIKEAQQSALETAKNFRNGEYSLAYLRTEKAFGVTKEEWKTQTWNLTASFPYYSLMITVYHDSSFYRAHKRVLHNGVADTLTDIRTRFWILKGQALVKKVLHQCKTCKVVQGKNLQAPPPLLPSFRVKEAPPFTNTGVDFASPLQVKWNSQDSCSQKCWICLFTCCVTRAVHLELVYDLTTHAFIRCFKRFSARRGLPGLIISDNGTTFKGASKVILQMIKRPEVLQHFDGLGIKWRFNIERAPWWGGLFERMVQSTKRCIRKYVGKAKLTQEELLTLTVEVEGVLNSRPLTHITTFEDGNPLTPSHL